KGEWIMKDGIECTPTTSIDWQKYGIEKVDYDWELSEDDLQFSIPVGLQMINDVILKPFPVEIDITATNIGTDNADELLLLRDREGTWSVNSVLQCFTRELGAICSTYSTTDDIILIGKQKSDMRLAWQRMKELGGGIVVVHKGKVIFELPLSLSGAMY